MLARSTILQRLSRLLVGRKILLDPAALFAEPFSPAPKTRLLTETPARLYLVEGDYLERLRSLPEVASAAQLAAELEKPGWETFEERFLPLDHPEGIIARFNRWFYLGKGELAFAEGQVPTGLARDPNLVRAGAVLLARLAQRTGSGQPAVLKLGAGCDVEPVRLLFEELARLGGGLAERCRVVVSDLSPPLMKEAARRAGLDPLLCGLAERGQVQFQVLDARRPELAEKFSLIESSYLYDSLPQRELARVGGRWYELKARPQLKGCSQRPEFLRLLAADDLEGLHQVPTHRFGYLDWEVVLDPLPAKEVPHRERLEDICRGAGDVAVPLGDALISGFEVLLPHLAPGGVLQTFDLGIFGLGEGDPHLKPAFKGPHRICAALFLGQNFALARRIFAERGLKVKLSAPEDYLEEMLGEEVVSLDRLWEAQHQGPEATERLLGADFVARFRGCLEGEGGSILRRIAPGHFLTRTEARALAAELAACGLDGQGFTESLFGARDRLGGIEANTYLQFRIESPEEDFAWS
jgi:hypothetical protein